jgi:hypothetical protein
MQNWENVWSVNSIQVTNSAMQCYTIQESKKCIYSIPCEAEGNVEAGRPCEKSKIA